MPNHPRATDLLVGFLDCCCRLRKTMEKDSGTSFIEEIQDAVTRLADSQPSFPQLSFNLRGIGVVERGTASLEQVDPCQDFPSNLVRHAVEPFAHWVPSVFLRVKLDLPEL